jgi:tRNA dimethylallyltransferase
VAKKAVFLLGPTASGKTAVALHLARRFPFEVVSVDSAQVYRGMDVGTAKPPPEMRAEVPHHLIDLVDPTEAYSAGRFRDDALRLASEIHARGRIPLYAGGTMLYFRALTQGLADLPAADPELRAEIDERAARLGWPGLHAELATLDPATAARLEPTDSQRIQRALEVHALTGEPLSALQARRPETSLPFEPLQLALEPSDRAVLHRRIAERFEAMLREGLLEELEGPAEALRAIGVPAVDARRGLPAGLGDTRGRAAGGDARRARIRRHAPAGQEAAHLASGDGPRGGALRLPAARPGRGGGSARGALPLGPGRPALVVAVVLEAHLHLDAVDELAALDLHVELVDLGHTQVAQAAPGSLHAVGRGIGPGLGAGADELDDFVDGGNILAFLGHAGLSWLDGLRTLRHQYTASAGSAP